MEGGLPVWVQRNQPHTPKCLHAASVMASATMRHPVMLMLVLDVCCALLATAADVLERPDDGFRLLDGHYVGRVGCDHRGDYAEATQPAGNISLSDCKIRCTALAACRGISFQRDGFHRGARGLRTNCLLKAKCTGRVVTVTVCEPDGQPPEKDCTQRRSHVFNYMRVLPLEATTARPEAGLDATPPPTISSDADEDWKAAFSRLQSRRAARVALLYLNLGAWPPWTRFILRAAAANHDVDFYFLGAPLDTSECANCARLPLSLHSLRDRIRQHLLNDSAVAQFGAKGSAARKLCDLVPMWPALVPELSARHAFVGITEHDMLPGDLSTEFARLSDADDMMLPLERFPQPLTDANFMVFRSQPKMLQAFRRVPGWEKVITSNRHVRFDEWVVEPPSIMLAFQEMLLASQLRVQPAQHFLVQDVIIIRKRRYPRIDDYGAKVVFRWRAGHLHVERDGPCICPKDVVPIYGITTCLECFHNPGVVLPTHTHRRLEVLGFHFSAWKKVFKWRGDGAESLGPTGSGSVLPAVPTCLGDFDITTQGFRCV